MKPTLKLALGLTLIALAVLALPVAFCQVIPTLYVDFPCFDEQVRQQELEPETRIVYCVSLWPREAISGGGIYAAGKSAQDEVKVGEFTLRWDDPILYVNTHAIKVNEVYTTLRLAPSLNPWIIYTSLFEFKNRGLTSIGLTVPREVLYVSGSVHESWFPNPLGLLILGCGIWLFRQGRRERRQAQDAGVSA